MANWFGKGRRGLIMGLWNSHTSLGNILGSLIAGAYVNTSWGLSFAVPGLLMTACGLLVYLFLVPSPAQVGLGRGSGSSCDGGDDAVTSPSSPPSLLSIRIPPPSNLKRIASTPKIKQQQQHPDSSGASSDSDSGSNHGGDRKGGPTSSLSSSSSAISFLEALRIPGVVEFSLCLFFAKLVSYTFLYWLPNYINSTSGVDAKESANLSTFFDFGGIVGGILAGLLSDRTGMSATTCAAMLVTAIPTLFLYEQLVTAACPLATLAGAPVVDNCYAANMLVLAITGALVNGPYALITTAVSAELGTHRSLRGGSNHRALATVTAIIDGTGSIGAAVGPLLAGWLTGGGSWDGVFSMLMASNVLALVFLSRLVRVEMKRWLRRRWAC
jgi:OPA family glycerol-3-phosphate transporter-like MFS transporter 1/2